MLSKLSSFSLCGVDGNQIVIETDIHAGLPKVDIVGLADASVRESKERVKSAIKNSGFDYPVNTITINLAPADLKKEGPIFDLSIAIGILSASAQIPVSSTEGYVILGELSLDGSVRKINGLLPILISARQSGFTKFIIPASNKMEASFIEGIDVYPVNSLADTVDFLQNVLNIPKLEMSDFENVKNSETSQLDFCLVKGQTSAKRALEIAAAGGHNVVMIGPPGSGKTMLAKCFATILPDMTFEESLETTKIHSVAGILPANHGIVCQRPFRCPHHTATTVSLTGGGTNSKPGEISLAHNGVLFLDELPEYARSTLEALRQPLEDGEITVARANQTVSYPASLTLLASMNPCPCGNFGSKDKTCSCSPMQIHRYLSKLSGPLMDRIDLHIEVDSVSYNELKSNTECETSAQIKSRVDKARALQYERYKNDKNFCNAKMSVRQIKKYCVLDDECEELLKMAFDRLGLSARAHDRILKVARTIADLEAAQSIKPEHIAEALGYRALDRKYWQN